MYTTFLLEKKFLTRGKTPIKRLVYTTQHGRKISLSCHRYQAVSNSRPVIQVRSFSHCMIATSIEIQHFHLSLSRFNTRAEDYQTVRYQV
jgi:hypothetical protein